MVKIRLKRMGSKFNAFYRIVVADERAPRDGKFIEEIGTFNPHNKQMKLNEELKDKWINEGAKPSDTVKNLFTKYNAAKSAGNINDDIVTLISKPKKPKKSKAVEIEASKDESNVSTENAEVATEEVKEETKTEEVKEENVTEANEENK